MTSAYASAVRRMQGGNQYREETNMNIRILGAGLAGCEAALYLADRGFAVTLYEQKPLKFSPAHKNSNFAELVCSN